MAYLQSLNLPIHSFRRSLSYLRSTLSKAPILGNGLFSFNRAKKGYCSLSGANAAIGGAVCANSGRVPFANSSGSSKENFKAKGTKVDRCGQYFQVSCWLQLAQMVSFGLEEFAEKYGSLKPSQCVDMISLVGDASDNIPGVEGIGNVHALELITKFGTMENLLQCVDHVEEERIRETLIRSADQAILSKNLALLRCDLPFYMVPFATNDLIFKKPEDKGEKFTSLLSAISAYAEGFSADPIIRRSFNLWKKLEAQ